MRKHHLGRVVGKTRSGCKAYAFVQTHCGRITGGVRPKIVVKRLMTVSGTWDYSVPKRTTLDRQVFLSLPPEQQCQVCFDTLKTEPEDIQHASEFRVHFTF